MEDLLEEARRQLLAEGWSIDQAEAALEYARKWAAGNADVGAAGDREMREKLMRNYLPRGIEQARQWLHRSRARWASEHSREGG